MSNSSIFGEDWKESYSSLEKVKANYDDVQSQGWYFCPKSKDTMLVLKSKGTKTYTVYMWNGRSPLDSIIQLMSLWGKLSHFNVKRTEECLST